MEAYIYLLLLGVFTLLTLVFIFRKRIKEVSFKMPLFSGAFKTHDEITSMGGRGGNASVLGANSTAIGGKGGGGGPGGKGGDGGDAHAVGEHSFALGGEGGEAGQIDRGGKGGRGPLHVLMEEHPDKFKEISKTFGITEEMAKEIGRGGDGTDPVKKSE